LEGQLRHEKRVADQEQGEKKHDVENLQSSQLGECIGGDRPDSSERKSAVARSTHQRFRPSSSDRWVASRKRRSSEVRDWLCSSKRAPDFAVNASISWSNSGEAFSSTTSV